MNTTTEIIYPLRSYVAAFACVKPWDSHAWSKMNVFEDACTYCLDAPQFGPAGSTIKNHNGYAVVNLFPREKP